MLDYEDHELPNRQETFFDRIHPDDNALALELGREVPFALAFLAKPDDGADSGLPAPAAADTQKTQ